MKPQVRYLNYRNARTGELDSIKIQFNPDVTNNMLFVIASKWLEDGWGIYSIDWDTSSILNNPNSEKVLPWVTYKHYEKKVMDKRHSTVHRSMFVQKIADHLSNEDNYPNLTLGERNNLFEFITDTHTKHNSNTIDKLTDEIRRAYGLEENEF